MAALSAATFGQGKIDFNNDSLHLVYFSTDYYYLNAGDQALAGTGLSGSTVLVGSPTIQADLWAGTSSSSLSLYKTTTFSAVPGKWTGTTTLLSSPLILGGTLTYFQVVVHDTRLTGSTVFDLQVACFRSMFLYFGWSPVFTAVPSASSYVNLYATAAPTSSTWPVGTQDLSALYGAGARGAIQLVALAPEPATAALAALGAAALLIRRRRL